MNGRTDRISRPLLTLLLFCCLLLAPAAAGGGAGAPVSRPGEYAGYSAPLYAEWVRSSQYVAARDKTLLAVDIFRPARGGEPVGDPLPVVWAYERYHRAQLRGGRLVTHLDRMPWLQTLLKHGYVIGVVDARGTGASFGTRRTEFAPEEAADAYDLTEWFAAQPWCSGRVGMYGRSYLGTAQYMAAGERPPHLKAIFPEMAAFDLYGFAHAGGIFRPGLAEDWSRAVKGLDAGESGPAPVDADEGGVLLAKARAGHAANRDPFELLSSLPFRDSRDRATGRSLFLDHGPLGRLKAVQESGVAVYHLAGWHDIFTRDALLWFNNLRGPKKLIIGPWHHTSDARQYQLAEHLRWYDYWLKGIDNKVLEEAPIHYFTTGATDGDGWRAADRWPLPDEQPTRFYFQRGPSGSIDSANDGLLGTEAPADEDGHDACAVDYSASAGTATRWADRHAGPFEAPSMAANDRRGLTYTTARLASDLELTGHPVVNLWVGSTAPDLDFFVYLEDVDEHGTSRLITEGALRASHRKTAPPAFDAINLPHRRNLSTDVARLNGEPVLLDFDLMPTSTVVRAGHRLRVTVTNADDRNAQTPRVSPPPTVTVLRQSRKPSHIILPVIPARQKAASPEAAQTAPPARPTALYAATAAAGVLVLLVLLLVLRRSPSSSFGGRPLRSGRGAEGRFQVSGRGAGFTTEAQRPHRGSQRVE